MEMNGIKNGRISLFALAVLIMASLACGNSTATRTPESKKIAPTLSSKAAQPTYVLGLPMLTSGKSGASACQPPTGWSPIAVQAGDTLESLALTYNATVEALIQANCLASDNLIPGTIMYIPGIPPTEPSVQCGLQPVGPIIPFCRAIRCTALVSILTSR
jgi:hypothetical protein